MLLVASISPPFATYRTGLAGASLLLTIFLTNPVAATTQVDCDTEDDLCTGDPCTTRDKLEVTASPCTLDFGTRTLVITKPIILPNGGQLSLSAAAIEVTWPDHWPSIRWRRARRGGLTDREREHPHVHERERERQHGSGIGSTAGRWKR
jgi:hypothetical protein